MSDSQAIDGEQAPREFLLPEIELRSVFVVDDEDQLVRGLERLLGASGYAVHGFTSPRTALAEIREDHPRVLIVDMDMPEMTGLELAARAREINPDLQFLMVTGAGGEDVAQASLRQGFIDYVTKPTDTRELMTSVHRAFMAVVRSEYEREMDSWLREEVRRQTALVNEVTLATLESLLTALETRSAHFRGHSQSVAVNAAQIARELGLEEAEVRSVRTAGLLHDIGMIAVSDLVVNKPGSLDRAEYEAVKAHCRRGADILEPMTHLGPVPRYVLEHHERLDGSGYPEGKRGSEISLGGQIVGLAEVWAGLTESRPYRDPMHTSQALATLQATSGTWFPLELIRALKASEV